MKPGILRNMRIKRVALVDAGANFDRETKDGAHIMLFKSAPNAGDVHVDTAGGGKKKPDTKVDDPNKEKPVKKSFIQRMYAAFTETDVEKRAAAVTELEKDFPPDADDTKSIHKADDPMCKCADCMAKHAPVDAAIEKRFTDLEKRNNELTALNASIEKRLNEEIEKAASTEMTTLLKSFKHTSIDLVADLPIFMKMKKLDPAGFDRQMAIMKATDAQLAQSALYGANIGSGREGGGDAWAQIEALADTMIQKSASPMTREQALEAVMLDKRNNRLVKQYRDAQQ